MQRQSKPPRAPIAQLEPGEKRALPMLTQLACGQAQRKVFTTPFQAVILGTKAGAPAAGAGNAHPEGRKGMQGQVPGGVKVQWLSRPDKPIR